MERAILPMIAEDEFALTARSAVLSFIANCLLSVSQGLSWSATVIMKIDLVGNKRRGLAMGLNEFAGYIAVAASSFATGFVAAHYGLRPEPFYVGVAFVALGLFLSVFLVRETREHAAYESSTT